MHRTRLDTAWASGEVPFCVATDQSSTYTWHGSKLHGTAATMPGADVCCDEQKIKPANTKTSRTFRYPVATFFFVAQRCCTSSSAFFMVSTASTFCLLWCTSDGPDSPRYHGLLVMNSGLWGLIILPVQRTHRVRIRCSTVENRVGPTESERDYGETEAGKPRIICNEHASFSHPWWLHVRSSIEYLEQR